MYRRSEDKLTKIFKKQRSLMKRYEQIEKENGLLQTDKVPVVLDSREGQARLKDFCWRITEEVAEAMQAYHNEGKAAFMEEVADVLHFLTEFTILADYNPWDLAKGQTKETDTLDRLFLESISYEDREDMVKELALEFIVNLGLTANCLKNKPWKKSHRDTDLDLFYTSLVWTWETFIDFAIAVGFTSETLFDAYFDKSSINVKRQESGY